MRTRTGILALIAALMCVPAHAQDKDSQARMDRFEQRLNEMEKRHQAELKTRDDEIARLKEQIEKKTAYAPVLSPAEKARQDILRDIDSKEQTTPTARTPANFNPDFAVVSDFLATLTHGRANDALNRLDVREVELDLRAAVDPRADGVAILAVARDVENPVFMHGSEELSGPDTSIHIEEAYLFLHDFGVPNLTAKLGRFHLRFGRQNILHLHDLPTSDPPLVNQSFLAPEALSDAGISLSYVIPNPWNQYIEVITEIISGEGADSESPTLRGDLTVDSPAFNTHILWNHDLNKDWNLELGASFLAGHADRDNSRNVRLYGLDATLIHSDPSGGSNNQLFQGELIYGDVDRDDNRASHAWGAYVLAQQQINKDWYAGVRLDWTQDPFESSHDAWAVSPYVSWYGSEFLRFRVEYQHRGGDVPDEDILFLQATWIYGAHPPHPYWSMR